MKLLLIASAAASLICGAAAIAQTDSAKTSPQAPTIYIGDFQPEQAITKPHGGPFHALEADMHARRVDKNAHKLSRAIAAALKHEGVAAEFLPADTPPHAGWIVSGTFRSLDGGHLVSLPFLGGHKGPNVTVTVAIADARSKAGAPVAAISTDARLKGQSSAISWTPISSPPNSRCTRSRPTVRWTRWQRKSPEKSSLNAIATHSTPEAEPRCKAHRDAEPAASEIIAIVETQHPVPHDLQG